MMCKVKWFSNAEEKYFFCILDIKYVDKVTIMISVLQVVYHCHELYAIWGSIFVNFGRYIHRKYPHEKCYVYNPRNAARWVCCIWCLAEKGKGSCIIVQFIPNILKTKNAISKLNKWKIWEMKISFDKYLNQILSQSMRYVWTAIECYRVTGRYTNMPYCRDSLSIFYGITAV